MDGIKQYGLSQAVSQKINSHQEMTPDVPSSVRTKKQADILVLEQSLKLNARVDTKVSFSLSDASGALSLTAEKVMSKLNQILGDKVPGKTERPAPVEYTPEATSDRIVKGATAFFGAYARQNPELEGEELLNGFMDTIRGGIDQGFDDAINTLKDIGAFDIEGVEDGVMKTKELIEEKLLAYESSMRERLGIDPIDIEKEVASQTADILTAGPKRATLDLAA